MLPDQPPHPKPPVAAKTPVEIAAHQTRLLAYLQQTHRLLLSFSVELFTAKDLQEATFLVRQLEAEIALLNWVLGRQETTWLDELEADDA